MTNSLPGGLGLTKLSGDVYEIRVDLKIRIILKMERQTVYLYDRVTSGYKGISKKDKIKLLGLKDFSVALLPATVAEALRNNSVKYSP